MKVGSILRCIKSNYYRQWKLFLSVGDLLVIDNIEGKMVDIRRINKLKTYRFIYKNKHYNEHFEMTNEQRKKLIDELL